MNLSFPNIIALLNVSESQYPWIFAYYWVGKELRSPVKGSAAKEGSQDTGGKSVANSAPLPGQVLPPAHFSAAQFCPFPISPPTPSSAT